MGVTDRSYAKTLASDKWDYAAAGYVLDTDQNATDPLDSLSGTFGATNVNVVVCLKHGTTTQEETGTSTYTVNYTGAANNPTSQPQTIDYTRTNTVDTMTGLVTAYGDWSVTGDRTSFTSITTPVVTGYVADKASSTVDNATPSEGPPKATRSATVRSGPSRSPSRVGPRRPLHTLMTKVTPPKSLPLVYPRWRGTRPK